MPLLPPISASPPSEPRAVSAFTLASFGFSWGFIIVRLAGLPAAATAFYRCLIGATLLALVARILRKPWRMSLPIATAGVLFGFHQLLFVAASLTTSIALVTLIGALQPLLVGALGRKALGEHTPRALYACAVMAVLGVFSVVYANRDLPSTHVTGLLLSVLNLLAYTAFYMASKRARMDGAHPLTLTASTLGIALVPIAPLLWWTPPHAESWQISLLALMAIVPGNGHLLINWAHPRVSATLGSLILSLVPVFASLWAYWLFDEPYGPLHVLGTLLTLGAVELGRRVAQTPSARHESALAQDPEDA